MSFFAYIMIVVLTFLITIRAYDIFKRKKTRNTEFIQPELIDLTHAELRVENENSDLFLSDMKIERLFEGNDDYFLYDIVLCDNEREI